MKLLFVLFASFLGLAAQAKKANPLAAIPVTDAGGHLTNGTLEVKRFIGKQGQVWALATLRGTVGGKEVTRGVQVPVTLSDGATPQALKKGAGQAKPVYASQAVQCELLNLAFGPIDVTVAGLDIQIAPVAVNITAVDVPAELICSVLELTGVIGTALDTVVGLLNTILGLLGGLGGIASQS